MSKHININTMSIIGQDPERDKKAHDIIYHGMSIYTGFLSFLGSCMGVPPNHRGSKELKNELKEKAWKIYSETGNIKKAVKVFFWNP